MKSFASDNYSGVHPKIIKAIVPLSVRDLLRYLKFNKSLKETFNNNYSRFKKYSFGMYNNLDSFEQLDARITKTYHSIEKGLSYDNLRLGFGVNNIDELLKLLRLYVNKDYSIASESFKAAISTLKAYIEVHEKNNFNVSELKTKLNEFVSTEENLGGTIQLTKKYIDARVDARFTEFSNSRHSIRTFSGESVDVNVITEAIEVAQNTPSACNRQSWKVRIIKDLEKKKILQENQNGNRGFGDFIDKYLLITTDIQYFAKPRELNQPYISTFHRISD